MYKQPRIPALSDFHDTFKVLAAGYFCTHMYNMYITYVYT